MKAALALSALSATAVLAYQHDAGNPLDIPARPLPGAVALHHAAQPLFDLSGDAAPLTLNHRGGSAQAALYGLPENRPWFVPEQPLALAADYTATSRTVHRDPATQRERVDHRHWTFRTADGQWRGTENLALDSLHNAHDPQLAVRQDGSVLALWQQSSDGEASLWWNLYNPANGWSEARKLAAGIAGNASLASNARGDAIAVWTATAADARAQDISEAVWASQYQRNRGWSAPSQIDRPGSDNSHLPRIALSANGSALAVWETHQADAIWGNHFEPGVGWGHASVLDHGGTELVDAPRVGADARGRFVMSWRRYRNADTALWARQYQPGTGWHYPQKLADTEDGRVHDHRLAVNSNGTAIALWSQGDSRTHRLFASRHTPGLGWQNPVGVQRDTHVQTALPTIALSDHGEAIAVWMQRRVQSDARWQVHASQFRAARWSTPGELAPGGESGYPRATIDANGNALVAWSRVDQSGDAAVWARRYSARSGWSTAGAITPNAAMLAALVVDEGGRALALGQRHDGNGHMRVWANRFE